MAVLDSIIFPSVFNGPPAVPAARRNILGDMADDLDKAFRRARRHPLQMFVVGKLGIIWTSTCEHTPVCGPIPGRDEIRDMDHADMVKDVQNEMDRDPFQKVDNVVRTVAHSHAVDPKTVYNARKKATLKSS